MAMKSIRAICAVVTLTIGVFGCASTKTDFQRIATLEDFTNNIADRRLILGDKKNISINHSDGTMTGTFNGNSIIGNWTWKNGFYCREGKLGNEVIEPDCLIMEIAGNSLRVTREKGSGSTSLFTIN